MFCADRPNLLQMLHANCTLTSILCNFCISIIKLTHHLLQAFLCVLRHCRRAEEFKIITGREFETRYKRLREEHGLDLDYNQIFNSQ